MSANPAKSEQENPSPRARARQDKILSAARQALASDGYAQFTLRSIAGRAGLSLSHLQYYFPSRQALVEALTESVAVEYTTGAAAAMADAEDDPQARFLAWIDFLIADCWQADTRRFFVQLWGLLESQDEPDNSLLQRFYAYDIDSIAELLGAMNPDSDASALRNRATVIASIIEGMMLMVGNAEANADDNSELKAETRRQILRIASCE